MGIENINAEKKTFLLKLLVLVQRKNVKWLSKFYYQKSNHLKLSRR